MHSSHTKSPLDQVVVSLLDVEPALGEWVSAEELPEVERAARLIAVDVEPGPFDPADLLAAGRSGFGALVVSGVIMREVSLGGQPSMRLLGPGDMFLDEEAAEGVVTAMGTWVAAGPARLAILDDHLLVAVRRWPRLLRGICARLQQGHETTLLQMAISHQPRVEERIATLFQLLSARWGRMSPDGVVVSLALTHEAIARMVGARRPTVSLALRALADEGRLARLPQGSWLLAPVAAVHGDFQPLEGRQVPRLVNVA